MKPASKPIVVKNAQPSPEGFIIPQPGERPHTTPPSNVDSATVEELTQETHRVAQFLTTVFDPDEARDQASGELSTDGAQESETILSSALQALIEELITQAAWNPQDFHQLVQKIGFALVEGVLEVINEWTCREFGGPLLEAEGDWLVDPEIAQAWRDRSRDKSV